jgi:hypothetical protein
LRRKPQLELVGRRRQGVAVTNYLLLMIGVMVLAFWYLVGRGDDCGDNGYLENGRCVYE